MKYISTSALAKELEVNSAELFKELNNKGFIEKKNSQWLLTEKGVKKGGKTKNNPKFGEYIVWPKENFDLNNDSTIPNSTTLLNATKIAKEYNISSQKMNLILSELGWIKKDIAGWEVTKQGKRLGGQQFEHNQSGGKYVLWPDSILENKSLKSVFSDESEQEESSEETANFQEKNNNFRDKFPATYRTRDGHMVRSRGEVIVDDTLYIYGIIHAYEKKLPIDENMYCDFFIPKENVYIEYWGMENDPKYVDRKKKKLEIYKKYEFNLIELNDDDIANLDDNLPRKLLKYNIKVY